MRWIVFYLMLAIGCASSHKLEVNQTHDTETESHGDVAKTTNTGPVKTTTTTVTENYGPAYAAPIADDAAADAESHAPEPWTGPAVGGFDPSLFIRSPSVGVPGVPGMVLQQRTTTTTVEERGAILEELKAADDQLASAHDELGVKTEDTRKPGGIFSLWFLLGLIPVAVALIFRKSIPILRMLPF